jgi:ubiquinone/menaquinone biosynthesis C-methylase UbiE
MNVLEELGRRFARFTTNQVVRRPALWRVLRRPMRLQFERLAPIWDSMRSPDSFAPLEAALASVEPPPRRVLDVGTGTGAAAFAVAERFPEAEIEGVDLSPEMVRRAQQKTPPALSGRLRFAEADSENLPFADDSFDLVTLSNMIPFFDELDRVLAPGGSVVFAFSAGAATPIYVPPERLRDELGRRGYSNFAEFAAGNGTALVARKPGSG